MNAYSFVRHGLALLAFGLACLVAQTSLAAAVSGTSGPTVVDSTSPSARYSPTNKVILAYSPLYADKTAADTAYVVVRKVDTVNGITNTVTTCPAGSGTYAFSIAAADDHRMRLLLTAYDSSDKAIGETLASDLVLPYAWTAGAAQVTVDTRANSLQEVAEAGGTALLAYDTKWSTNGVPASVKISRERICRTKAGRLVSATTNDLFSANAPATGDFAQTIDTKKGGAFTYRLSFLDALGKPLGEDLTASYGFPFRLGFILSFH